jgi:hypothetical protein
MCISSVDPKCLLIGSIFLSLIVCGCRPRQIPDSALHTWTIEREIGPIVVGRTNQKTLEESFEVHNPSTTQEMVLDLKGRNCQCLDCKVNPQHVLPGGKTIVTVLASLSSTTKDDTLTLLFDTGLDEARLLRISLRIKTLAAIEFRPYTWPTIAINMGQSKTLPFEVVAHQELEDAACPIVLEYTDSPLKLCILEQVQEKLAGIRVTTARCEVEIPGQIENEHSNDGKGLILARQGNENIEQVIRWERKWPLIVEPRQAFLHADRTKDTEQSVRIRGDKAFRVTKLQASEDYLILSQSPKEAATEHWITIRCKPFNRAPKASSVMVIGETDHSEQPGFRFRVLVLWRTSN